MTAVRNDQNGARRTMLRGKKPSEMSNKLIRGSGETFDHKNIAPQNVRFWTHSVISRLSIDALQKITR
jgi:hypothetical protein